MGRRKDMRLRLSIPALCWFTLQITSAYAQVDADPVTSLVSRLDLEKYKATIKGLTQFGDRRQGTDRNRAAIDWIEAQLKSYGCANTERLKYEYGEEPPHRVLASSTVRQAGTDQPDFGVGGARQRGTLRPAGVNNDPKAQPNARIRALDAEPAKPGEREEVWSTKIGAAHPGEMYIVSAHMDGIGWGEAANDNGSGTALVLGVARIPAAPPAATHPTARRAARGCALGTNEGGGLTAARAYVEQRQALQGREEPTGSGHYPEPTWLGMIQHAMMLFHHGMAAR